MSVELLFRQLPCTFPKRSIFCCYAFSIRLFLLQLASFFIQSDCSGLISYGSEPFFITSDWFAPRFFNSGLGPSIRNRSDIALTKTCDWSNPEKPRKCHAHLAHAQVVLKSSDNFRKRILLRFFVRFSNAYERTTDTNFLYLVNFACHLCSADLDLSCFLHNSWHT